MNYKKVLETEFSGGKSIHVTRQTLNGKQQTLTGYHITHHTTGTVFQTNQAIDTDVTLLCISKLSRWKTEFKTVVITKFQKKNKKTKQFHLFQTLMTDMLIRLFLI